MNFFKAYKDKVVNAESYRDDYIYYLFDSFVKNYIPKVIEEAIANKKSEVNIAIRDIEKYFKEIIMNGIEKAIQNGVVSEENKEKLFNNYVTDYIAEATKYLSTLPFLIKEGYITGDLVSFIQFYYEDLQRDAKLLPKNEREKQISKYTEDTFRNEVLSKLIPELIQYCKDNNCTTVRVEYEINKDVVTFGNLSLSGLNLYEFGSYVNRIPHQDLTYYNNGESEIPGENLQNKYRFGYYLSDLEKIVAQMQVVNKEQALESPKPASR